MDKYSATGLTACFTSGLLTATGAVTTYDTTVTINFSIDGKMEQRAAVTTGTTPTTDYNTGVAFPALVGGASVANTPGYGCIVLWGLITGASVRCVMGPHQRLDMLGKFVTAPQYPAIPAGFVPFAVMELKAGATGSATALVFGTANWNAAGFTNTITNISTLPSRVPLA
jgi:hypothetical protein